MFSTDELRLKIIILKNITSTYRISQNTILKYLILKIPLEYLNIESLTIVLQLSFTIMDKK